MVQIELIGLILGVFVTAGGLFLAIHRIMSRFEKLEKEAAQRKEDDRIMLLGIQACLDGLKQQGANGSVTKMIAQLNEHIVGSR